MTIKAKIISRDNFSAYGKVVTGISGQPTSQAADYKFWSDIMNFRIEGETEVGLCTVFKQDSDSITGMERHLMTPELLIPIDGPFILPLLIDRNAPEKAEAFVVDIGQAITINPEVWHGACLPANGDECTYFVIFKRGTPHNDVEKINLSPINISQ